MTIEELVAESFNEEITAISDSTEILNLDEWDSMSHMFFITKLEEVFSIDLDGDEIAALRTVNDIKKILKAKGANG